MADLRSFIEDISSTLRTLDYFPCLLSGEAEFVSRPETRTSGYDTAIIHISFPKIKSDKSGITNWGDIHGLYRALQVAFKTETIVAYPSPSNRDDLGKLPASDLVLYRGLERVILREK